MEGPGTLKKKCPAPSSPPILHTMLRPPPCQVTTGGSLHSPPASACSRVWSASPGLAPWGLSQTLADSSLSAPQGAEADRPGGVHPHRNFHLPGTCTQGTFVRLVSGAGLGSNNNK